jgi:mycothiol synthase
MHTIWSSWTTTNRETFREAFLGYCRQNRHRVDDTWLGEESLDAYMPDGDNPSLLLMEGDTPVGAASVMVHAQMRRAGEARFRILCHQGDNPDAYAVMLQALREQVPHLPDELGTEGERDISHWFVFVPDGQNAQNLCLEANGFSVYRTSHILVRNPAPLPEVACPAGVSFRPFLAGQDEQIYCDIRNAAFATLKGSEAPLLPEDVADITGEYGALPGGIVFLCQDGVPIGVVRAMRDDSDAELGELLEIGPLAILPGHQKKGLGTVMIRHILKVGAALGLPRAVLCVNAENTPALGLYLREGFAVHLGFTCYRQSLVD